MSNTAANDEQPVDEIDVANWYVAEPVEPEPSWGPFLPWRAAKPIRKLTRGNVQHIALILAMNTPRDGKSFVVQEHIAEETGRSDKAVRAAFKELVSLGILMKAKRTMGGFNIIWGKVAYGITEADKGGQGKSTQGENTFSNVQEIRDALRLDLRPAYCVRVVARYPDDLTDGSPEVRKLALLTDSGENVILDNLVFFANSQNSIPIGQIVDKALERWMLRKGEGDFLIKRQHPLQRFSEDVGRIVCRMLAEIQKSKEAPKRENSAAASNDTTALRSTKYTAREIEEHKRITAARMAALPKGMRPTPKGMRPKFYTHTAA